MHPEEHNDEKLAIEVLLARNGQIGYHLLQVLMPCG